MKIINLTPHDIVFKNEESGETEVFKSEGIARVDEFLIEDKNSKYKVKWCINGFVEGLPSADKDTVYIVSSKVREELPERGDLWSPTGFIRDENGNIVGCTGFIRN